MYSDTQIKELDEVLFYFNNLSNPPRQTFDEILKGLKSKGVKMNSNSLNMIIEHFESRNLIRKEFVNKEDNYPNYFFEYLGKSLALNNGFSGESAKVKSLNTQNAITKYATSINAAFITIMTTITVSITILNYKLSKDSSSANQEIQTLKSERLLLNSELKNLEFELNKVKFENMSLHNKIDLLNMKTDSVK